ncbi:stress response translation initiation inhibitor YciH [Candidatus Bathyarchaeota archaeon]|nr:MAG: stress response translation initiation inhibitor YciH [Candidatus Bathyarchaeota archaeon]
MAEICEVCGLPKDLCVCGEISKDQQKIKVRLEKRKWNKPVTIVEGIDTKGVDINKLAAELKAFCACGGTAKNNQIILQGDHREKAKEKLIALGFSRENIEVQ